VEYDDGDIVITEADRGLDIGQIVTRVDRPPPRELKTVKQILRRALPAEIDSIAAKEERESQALMLCRSKVQELGLPMEVTGAEYQFDGKKLTFYYNATKYIDFRNLVRTLFRIFGTRIWMMWYDGGVPVRDVFTRLNEDID
jgi:cell fate regulator YaaT (PSP1 superfamily)